MEKQKQIERMGKKICKVGVDFISCSECTIKKPCKAIIYATRAIEAGYGDVKQYQDEIDRLQTELSHREEDLIHADENVFYRECNVKLSEDDIKKQAVREFAEAIKKEIFSILVDKHTGIVQNNEIEFCTSMTKQILYQINKHLNEDFGFNMQLDARNQFNCEPELTHKYQEQIKKLLLKEYEE